LTIKCRDDDINIATAADDISYEFSRKKQRFIAINIMTTAAAAAATARDRISEMCVLLICIQRFSCRMQSSATTHILYFFFCLPSSNPII